MRRGNVWFGMISTLGELHPRRANSLSVLRAFAVSVLLLCAGGCGLLARAPAEEPQPAPPGLETAWQGKPVPYKVRI